MQVCFGSFVPAAAVVLNPKESIHWGYTLTAAVVMTTAAFWIVFVLTTLWLHCSDDHMQCSYIALSGSAELQTPTKFSEKSATEAKSNASSSDLPLTCISTITGMHCVTSKQSLYSQGSEGEPLYSQGSLGPAEISFGINHFADHELELATKDAATEELLKLRALFAMPVVTAVVLPEVNQDAEPDPEPEPFKLEAFGEDGAVPAQSDREVESDGNQDDTWAGCWRASGWGARGIWTGGAIQGDADQSFGEMTVT